ncbi:MAG TPA: histidine kinase [Bacteroidales bacterium]|nr:histidine kinase [Bacteroidales bacterium]
MINIHLKKTRIIFSHCIFWIAVWFFYVYFFSYNSNDKNYIIWFSSFMLPVTIGTTYFMVYYLVPKFLLTKKYWKFALYSFYTVIISSNIIVPLIFGSFIFISDYNITHMPPMSKNIVFVLIMVYLIVGLVSFVYLLNYNFQTISKNKELQNKILETQLQLKEQELQYLKMQIHPHFLFNTLNTIYGFALKQSKQTPEIILMLSNLLDYILYQINKPKVSLKEEVLHIKEYIELEKVRFQDTLKVLFSANEINEDIQIAPMLLIPFVENAFKHGNIIEGSLKVEINVKVIESQLDFSVKNTSLANDSQKENHGIGLENIKKRLELNYTNNYKLDIYSSGQWYNTSLTIFNLNTTNNA